MVDCYKMYQRGINKPFLPEFFEVIFFGAEEMKTSFWDNFLAFFELIGWQKPPHKSDGFDAVDNNFQRQTLLSWKCLIRWLNARARWDITFLTEGSRQENGRLNPSGWKQASHPNSWDPCGATICPLQWPTIISRWGSVSSAAVWLMPIWHSARALLSG